VNGYVEFVVRVVLMYGDMRVLFHTNKIAPVCYSADKMRKHSKLTFFTKRREVSETDGEELI
jgi:hypothetical protein